MYRDATTLEDIYRLALPQGSRVLFGRKLLGRPVSWACSLRPSPPAFPNLEGEELALIDIEDLRQIDPQMRLDRVINSLHQARISAIGVLGDVPEDAVAVAEENQDPADRPLRLRTTPVGRTDRDPLDRGPGRLPRCQGS